MIFIEEFPSTVPSIYSYEEDNISLIPNCKYFPLSDFLELNNDSNFNIFHNNLNGLENKIDLLTDFSSTKFDILAISETSEKEQNHDFISNVSINGYNLFSTPSKSIRGGVALYVKSFYNIFERTELKSNSKHFEAVWVEIMNKKNKNIICASIYRHPQNNIAVVNEFLEYIESILTRITSENKNIYICGDLNFDLLKVQECEQSKNFFDLMCSFGLINQITIPTRTTESTATIIDNIYTNNVSDKKESGNILTDFSDHFSQFLSLEKSKIDVKRTKLFKRDYSNFSVDSFRDDVSIQNFHNNFTDVNDKFNDFYFKLEGCINRHAPIKQLTQKQLKYASKPWISPEIQKLIRIRNNIFKRKKNDPHNLNIRRLYNKFRNRVNRELKKSKINFYTNYFETNDKNIKKTWEGIKSLVNIKKANINTINQLKSNGNIIDNPKSIAQKLNDFFVNVGPNVEKTVPANPVGRPESFLKERNQFNFLVTFISNEDVFDIIKNLDNKAIGPYGLPVDLLKMIPDLIIFPLCQIINLSFTSGKFPDVLKIAKVVPIFKSGSPVDVNNYRPISLLSIFDKIIEKLMYKQLYEFLTNNNILHTNQFGFRKNMSTSLALIQITERIREAIDKKKIGCGIFIDLSKAFDTVNHKILLKKLEHYGIRGTPLRWFESYLSNRKQYVFLNGESSSLESLTCGVPQGSVLGPLLFLIYINDLPNISKKLEFFLFADDTNLYYESKSLEDLEKTVNKELKKLNNWLIINRLSLNIGKTNFVIFHPYNKKIKKNVTLKINKKAISEKSEIRYLGVTIDSTLTWKQHIEKVSVSVRRAIGMIYKIRPYVTQRILIMIYFSLIYSHLTYAIEVWRNAHSTHINRIFTLQKRVVRAILYKDIRQSNFSLPSSNPLFIKLNILKFHDIYRLKLIMFAYKCLYRILPINFYDWFLFTNRIHNHNTRSNRNNNLFLPRISTTNYGLKSIKYNGAKIWNTLHDNIKRTNDYVTFKKLLKEYLLSQ